MRRLRVLAISLVLVGLPTGAARADDVPICHSHTDLGHADQGCAHSGTDVINFVLAHSDNTFVVHEACATGNATCSDTPSCDGGLVYNIWEDGVLLPWQACLSLDQQAQINGLTPGYVRRAFRRLTWPASTLLIQPPHGRTLVNFATNFYTTNTHPTTQTVTLLGQRVSIEATPTQYTWHFGDDTDLATSQAGAPYPDLEVTHRYLHPGTVRPSLDTTYTGRYHVDGGAWQAIPETLTVPGHPETLSVLTATPHLVG